MCVQRFVVSEPRVYAFFHYAILQRLVSFHLDQWFCIQVETVIGLVVLSPFETVQCNLLFTIMDRSYPFSLKQILLFTYYFPILVTPVHYLDRYFVVLSCPRQSAFLGVPVVHALGGLEGSLFCTAGHEINFTGAVRQGVYQDVAPRSISDYTNSHKWFPQGNCRGSLLV